MLSFFRKPKPVASAIVTVGHNRVKVDLSGEQTGQSLSALSLCYAAKLRWLMLSEEDLVITIFQNVYCKIIETWPEIPYVEMIASLGDKESKYIVDVRHDPKGAGWFVTNQMPSLIRHRGDIATHYFFMLNQISKTLNYHDCSSLGEQLQRFAGVLFPDIAIKKGMSGLSSLNRSANAILNRES